MTTRIHNNTNGRVERKTLASQIDRLDAILDGLADSLDDAVAAAVKEAVMLSVQEAVREGVQAAVTEVLTNPALQQRLHTIATPDSEVKPVPSPWMLGDLARRCWSQLTVAVENAWNSTTTKLSEGCAVTKAAVQGLCHMVYGGTQPLVQKVCSDAKQFAQKVVSQASQLREHAGSSLRVSWMRLLLITSLAWRCRTTLFIALGVGTLVSAACYLAGPVFSAVLCGVSGFVASLVASAVYQLRRLLPGVEVPNL